MTGSFQYEWWTVDILLPTGRIKAEYKGRNRANVVRQIEREVKKSNSPENLAKPWYEFPLQQIKEVYWDTLELDRVGYQREY